MIRFGVVLLLCLFLAAQSQAKSTPPLVVQGIPEPILRATAKCLEFAHLYDEFQFKHKDPARIWEAVGFPGHVVTPKGKRFPDITCKFLFHNDKTDREWCQGWALDPKTLQPLAVTKPFACTPKDLNNNLVPSPH